MDPQALLEQLTRDPDPGLLRVYADLALERGDPRGELIGLQCAREDQGGPVSPRELALVAQAEAALHALPGFGDAAFRWRSGFLHTVTAEVMDTPRPDLRALAERPEARLLQRLVLNAVTFDGSEALTALWNTFPTFARLERLEVQVGLDLGNPYIEGPIELGQLQSLYSRASGLRVLELHGRRHELGAIELPRLTRFAASRLSASAIPSLVAARWPLLEELDLEFGPAQPEEVEPLFGPLLDAPMSPALRRVRVKSPWPEFFSAALPRSELGKGREVSV